jgi:hypothetical protein
MADNRDRINDIFETMVNSGRVSISNRWIEKASIQRNPKLTLELANSRELTYDITDRLMLTITDLN